MDTERLEETAAQLLGQIQASVAENVRAMNEANATRRRESDEAHRQHERAVAMLGEVVKESRAINVANMRMIDEIQLGWAKQIQSVALDVSSAQAAQHAKAVVLTIELRSQKYLEKLGEGIEAANRVVERAGEINRTLAWKSIGVGIAWGMLSVAAVVVLIRT